MANKAVVGEKVGMTQVWDDANRVVPVTVLRVEPMRVVQVKTAEHDGYNALQVTFGEKDARKLNNPDRGHFEKAGVTPRRHVAEIRTENAADYQPGRRSPSRCSVPGRPSTSPAPPRARASRAS